MLKPFFKNSAINESSLEFGGQPVAVTPKIKPEADIKAIIKARLILLAPVIVSVLLSIVGQLILKRGMSDLGPISLSATSIFSIFWSIATNPFVVVGMVIFVGSVLCWLVGLSRVQLSLAYPLISLSYVVILAASYFLLNEQISLLRILGVILISVGVILVALS